MASMNKVILLGNLTDDPELRYLENGTPLCKFSLAVNSWSAGGERTCFINIVCFGNQAEPVAQHLKRGSLAAVDGRLQQREWEDSSGNKRRQHEVLAQNVQFL